MKKLPKFKNLEEEIRFWDTHNILEYTEESDELILGGPKTETVNVRIESQVKQKIEEYSRKNRVDTSDMIRGWIYEGLEREISGQLTGVDSSAGLYVDSLSADVEEIKKGIYDLTSRLAGRDPSRLGTAARPQKKVAAKKKTAAKKR